MDGVIALHPTSPSTSIFPSRVLLKANRLSCLKSEIGTASAGTTRYCSHAAQRNQIPVSMQSFWMNAPHRVCSDIDGFWRGKLYKPTDVPLRSLSNYCKENIKLETKQTTRKTAKHNGTFSNNDCHSDRPG